MSRPDFPVSRRLAIGRHALSLVVLALVAACGSGGGGTGDGDTGDSGGSNGGSNGGNTPGASELYDLDAAITRVYRNGFQANNLQATDSASSKVYSMAFAIQPLTDQVVFEGSPQLGVRRTTAARDEGTSQLSTQVVDQYFLTGPFRPSGSLGNDGSYQLTRPTGVLPTSVLPGTSGPLSAANIYSDSGKTTLLAQSVTTWSLARQSDSQAFLCFNTTIIAQSGGSSAENAECYLIDRTQSGLAVGAKVTITLNTSAGSVKLEFR